MTIKLMKLIVGAVGATLILTAQAQAQQVPGRSTTGTSSVSAAATMPAEAHKFDWRIKAGTELMRVPLNKMVSVRIPADSRVIIGNPDIVNIVGPEEAGRTQVYFLGQAVGSTSVFFEDGDGNILFHGDIQVDVDVTGIQSAIHELMPEEKVVVTSQRNGVFLKGFVRSAGASAQAVDVARSFVPDALNIINNLEVLGSRQVIMQVRVAEIKRTALKQLGFDYNFNFNPGVGGADVASFASALAATNVPTAIMSGSLGNLSYRVMEQNNLAKTLAEPSLTAISGETATFLAGGTFPMLTGIDKDGNRSYEQQPFGVRLNFTPTVMDNGQINLHLGTEISDIDNTIAVDGIPGLTMKRTETIVDLPSGGSLMLSGLIQNDFSALVKGVPGLKNLPILGALFRSNQFIKEETELIITVTAYLANPVGNDARLALPTDGFAAPNELDHYLLGHLHKRYTKSPLPPYATPLVGPYGYIME